MMKWGEVTNVDVMECQCFFSDCKRREDPELRRPAGAPIWVLLTNRPPMQS